MQAAGGHPAIDRISPHPNPEQLPPRHHPMLPPSEVRDALIPASPF
jgi:hypothetical protein